MSTFDEYLGVIARSHGLDGTMILTDVVVMPRPLLAGATVNIGYSREFARPYTVAEYSATSYRTTIRVREITSAEAVEPLIDQAVYAHSADLGIDETVRYRIGDVEGCVVCDETGNTLGTVTDVWLMPANDVWIVTTADGRTIPLPVINEVILNVDLNQRRITARLLPGLADVDMPDGERDDD